MKFLSAIGGGFAGAVALTALHESLRRLYEKAPRMDLLGMEATGKSLRAMNIDVPDEPKLFKLTMAGDIISNSLYYSLTGIGSKKGWALRGAALGLAAGAAAVYLPAPLGLNEKPANRTVETKLLTIALYLTGGIVASVVAGLLEKGQNK